MRGGELVLDAIARLVIDRFEPAGIFTMFDDGRPLTPTIDSLVRFSSSLNRVPGGPDRLRRWLLPFFPHAVAELSNRMQQEHTRTPIRLLVSTSSAAVKGIRPPEGVPHVCYCHTPARYLWSQSDEYGRGRAGGLRVLGLKAFGPRLRSWDARTASNVTEFIANSTYVARLIGETYRRDARVIHPPVRTEYFTPPEANVLRSGWLFAGALEPYKRVDLAVAAALKANRQLTIIGSGSMLDEVRHAAADSRGRITVRGRVSDSELREAYRSAQVLLFPQLEDFGITAVEAQACGTPVAALGTGGAIDTVVPGQTGALMSESSVDKLIEAAHQCEQMADPAAACRANALRFSEAAFNAAMSQVLDTHVRH